MKIHEFESLEECENFFNETFPDGVSVYRDDDGLHFFSYEVRPLRQEGNEDPLISFFPVHIPTKVIFVNVSKVEEHDDGVVFDIYEGDERRWTFSKNISPEMKKALQEEREDAQRVRDFYA